MSHRLDYTCACSFTHIDILVDYSSMHSFVNLFQQIDIGESIDGISLTLHLQDCVARLVPDLAQLFSVSVSSAPGFLNSAEENKTDNPSVPADRMQSKDSNEIKEEEQDKNKLASDSTTMPLSKAGLPDISINYEVIIFFCRI